MPRLLALARPEWKSLAIGTFFLAVGSAMNLVYPQLIKRIIDESLGPAGSGAVDRAALLMVGVFFLEGLATGARYHTFTVTGERIVTTLRERLYRHLLAQEIAFFDAHRTGELTSRLASDTTVLQNAVSVNVSMTLRSLASVIGGMGLLLYTSPLLTALMLAVVPVVSVGA
ncbi:MAG TPA: ABC transporter transmembrane domain-containing protein, partial [Myxococcota bacterium]|nr:ABC transporter transmembrane domain-containing protein [Myxococcota bacterium]